MFTITIIGIGVITALFLLFIFGNVMLKKNKANIHYGYKGDVIYSDDSNDETMEVDIGNMTLQGKPDIVIKTKKDELIVIDLKSGKKKAEINQGYKLQIGTYFILLENKYNIKPKFGVLHYLEDNQQDIIENTDELYYEVLKTAEKIAQYKIVDNNIPKRNHNIIGKCYTCQFNNICNENLKT